MKKKGITEALSPLFHSAQITALDVGARGGFSKDLLPIAPVVNAIGFEPDPEECKRLNGQDVGPWRSQRFIPTALGRPGKRNLNLYRKRGCSSFLEADLVRAKEFGRDAYFILDGSISVETIGLDEAAEQYGFQDAGFLKIDIQGAENEVFETGPRFLDQILAVRTEVSFIPIYRNQPLIEDVIAKLRGHGLVPMGFQELHHWRRKTMVKPHVSASGDYPFSEGQMVHGDLLFFREQNGPKGLEHQGHERVLGAALIALSYGYVDHAHDLLQNRGDMDFLQMSGVPTLDGVVKAISKTFNRHRRTALGRFKDQAKHRLAYLRKNGTSVNRWIKLP